MRYKIDRASLIVGRKFTVFALFSFLFDGNFPSTSPQGFFALPVWGAYIWRGLYIEGLIFGILRYVHTIPYSFCASTKIKADRTSFHT